MEQNLPKTFVIQFGSLIMLYVAATALLVLLFNVINIIFPDALTYYSTTEAARGAVRTAIATVVVFFPAYVILMRSGIRAHRGAKQGSYSGIMRWLVYLSLLIAGLILLGDLVTLLRYFLNGEITVRFILKVVTLFLVIGAIFYYYLQDVRGYFTTHTHQVRWYALISVAVVTAAVIVGLLHIETPQQVREARLDDQMVADLQSMQYAVDAFHQQHGTLPATLTELYPNGNIPQPPVTGTTTIHPAYEYTATDSTHYQLCATFFTDSASLNDPQVRPVSLPGGSDWSHRAGRTCFSRVVTTAAKSGQ